MHFSRIATSLLATALFTSSTTAQVNIPINIPGGSLLGSNINLGLFQPNSLVNVDAFVTAITSLSCSTNSTLGVIATAGLGIPLLSVCACLNAADLLSTPFQTATNCPPCAANSNAICANGQCACACKSGFFADPSGVCIPVTDCPAPNVIVNNADGTSFCNCTSPYVSNGAGQCVLPTTQRARAMHRKSKKSVAHPHAARAGQEVLSAPVLKPIDSKSETCPDGETACRLSTGGFECIDTTNALNSCGGCVGQGLPGQNCLAIPGALNVQCEASECKVSSCFKGWSMKNGKCV